MTLEMDIGSKDGVSVIEEKIAQSAAAFGAYDGNLSSGLFQSKAIQ